LDNHPRAPNWVSCEWLGFESLSQMICLYSKHGKIQIWSSPKQRKD
jgi:hypothetical protein